MPGRGIISSSGARYGFNGKENDNEVKGLGNQQDYGMRIYDPRLGKFLSIDPLTSKFVFYTPYQFAGNKPIVAIDLDGLEDVWTSLFVSSDGYTITQTLTKDDENYENMRWRWAKNMGVDVALLPTTGIFKTKVNFNSDGKAIGIQYSYSPTVVVFEHKNNILVRFLNRVTDVMTRSKGKTTNEWEGREAFENYVDAFDKTGEVVEQAAPLTGEFAPLVKGIGSTLGIAADVFNTSADIEEKGLSQGAKNGLIRIGFWAAEEGVDYFFKKTGGSGLESGDAATAGYLKYTGERIKDKMIEESNEDYYNKMGPEE